MSDWQIEPKVKNQVYFWAYVMQDNTDHVKTASALNCLLYFNPQRSGVQTTDKLLILFIYFFLFYRLAFPDNASHSKKVPQLSNLPELFPNVPM